MLLLRSVTLLCIISIALSQEGAAETNKNTPLKACIPAGAIAYSADSAYSSRAGRATLTHSCNRVTSLPRHLTFLTRYNFYRKYTHAYGVPIVSSSVVTDRALKRACNIIRFMLADRDDLRQSIYRNYARFGVIATTEHTTTIPEFRHLPNWWNTRARGLGGVLGRPMSTGGEENILCLPQDRYRGEDIFFHESAHNIAEVGLKGGLRSIYDRLQASYRYNRNRWAGDYAQTDGREYWAEGLQYFFENNPKHSRIRTRAQLARFDLSLYNIIREVYPCMNRYTMCNDNFLRTMRMNCNGRVITPGPSIKPVTTLFPPKPTKCIYVWESEPVRNDNCVDKHRNCRSWASSGECQKNPSYMKPNCCKSCGGGGGGGSCTDNNSNCPGWAKGGYCRTNPYTQKNCKKSCGTCTTTKKKVKKCWVVTAEPPTDPPVQTTPHPPIEPTTTEHPPIEPETDGPPVPVTTKGPVVPPTTDSPPLPVTTDSPPLPVTTKRPVVPPTTDGPPVPKKCEIPVAVGLESKSLPDSAMTASSIESQWHGPGQARLNLKESSTGIGAWCASVQDVNQYLQIDLGQIKTVKQVSIQGRESKYPKYVTKFTIAYSEDNSVWNNYNSQVDFTNTPEVFPGNTDMKTIKDVKIKNPFPARYIRVKPSEWKNMICMRLELYTCK